MLALTSALAGCGDDKSAAEDGCDRLFASYTSTWKRCQVADYETLRDAFSEQLGCGSVEHVDADKLNTCIDAVKVLNCGAATTIPGACTDIFAAQ